MDRWMDGWVNGKAGRAKLYTVVGGWVDGWVGGWKSRLKDCLQQSKIKSIGRILEGYIEQNMTLNFVVLQSLLDLPLRSNNNKFGNYGSENTEENNNNNNCRNSCNNCQNSCNNCQNSCSGGCNRCQSDCCRHETVNNICNNCIDDGSSFDICQGKQQGCKFNIGDFNSAPSCNCYSCSCKYLTKSSCYNCETEKTVDCLCNKGQIENNSTAALENTTGSSEIIKAVNLTDGVQICSCKCASEAAVSCGSSVSCKLSTIVMSNCTCNCTQLVENGEIF